MLNIDFKSMLNDYIRKTLYSEGIYNDSENQLHIKDFTKSINKFNEIINNLTISNNLNIIK